MCRCHCDPSSLSMSSAIDAITPQVDQLMHQFDTHGDIEFKLDERTFRMIPLANSEDYMYKRNSLTRAAKV